MFKKVERPETWPDMPNLERYPDAVVNKVIEEALAEERLLEELIDEDNHCTKCGDIILGDEEGMCGRCAN